MSRRLTLAYGRTALPVRVPDDSVIAAPPTPGPAPEAAELFRRALDQPIASPPLERMAARARRVLVIVSDTTRPDPRDALVRAVVERLPSDVELTLAVANGTHGPCDPAGLGIGADLLSRAALVNHDAHSGRDMVEVGATERGTPVVVHRCVIETELVVATGCIKPHYFAGYGAGCKAIFPGLGGNREIRVNHRLKLEPGARAGVVEGNPCRDDLEEAVAHVPTPKFLLNGVLDGDGAVQSAVAGDVQGAFAEGARRCAPYHRVRVRKTPLIVVSDRPPITASLYQASKLVAAVAPALEEGGTIVVAAECWEGTGPVDTVNEAIYEIGLRPRLPDDHRIVLVSSLGPEQVRPTYCSYGESVESVVDRHSTAPTIFPRAGSGIVDIL